MKAELAKRLEELDLADGYMLERVIAVEDLTKSIISTLNRVSLKVGIEQGLVDLGLRSEPEFRPTMVEKTPVDALISGLSELFSPWPPTTYEAVLAHVKSCVGEYVASEKAQSDSREA